MRVIETFAVHKPKNDASLNLVAVSSASNFKMSPAPVRAHLHSLRSSRAIEKNTELLRVVRMTTTPEILRAVGLCRAPKTYSKKKLTLDNVIRFETNCKVNFCANSDFGSIDFEL